MAVATWIYGDGMIILVEGQKILRWEVYIVIFLIRLTAAFVSYQLVKNIRYKMEVKILDSAIIDNRTWFYVSLPVDTLYNCRGWINEDDFSLVYSLSKDIPSNFK